MKFDFIYFKGFARVGANWTECDSAVENEENKSAMYTPCDNNTFECITSIQVNSGTCGFLAVWNKTDDTLEIRCNCLENGVSKFSFCQEVTEDYRTELLQMIFLPCKIDALLRDEKAKKIIIDRLIANNEAELKERLQTESTEDSRAFDTVKTYIDASDDNFTRVMDYIKEEHEEELEYYVKDNDLIDAYDVTSDWIENNSDCAIAHKVASHCSDIKEVVKNLIDEI